MDKIIVTVTNQKQQFFIDIEVPTNRPIQILKEDIKEALQGYDPDRFGNASYVELYCNRLSRHLLPDDTMESVGAWNGDYITLFGV